MTEKTITVVGRVNELAASEGGKVYIRLSPETDSHGEVIVRIERAHPEGVSLEGWRIGAHVRVTVVLLD